MRTRPSVWAGRLLCAWLSVASLPAAAQVGQKPHVGKEVTSDDRPTPVPASPRPTSPASPCAAEIDKVLASARSYYSAQHTLSSRAHFEKNLSSWSSASCSSLNIPSMLIAANAQLAEATEQLAKARAIGGSSALQYQALQYQVKFDNAAFGVCSVRAAASLCGGSSSPSGPGPGGEIRTPVKPTTPSAPVNSSPYAELNKQLDDAVALAQKRQAEVDRARAGRPKLHKSGSIAHACLRPQPGGGVVNDCPYAVEYHYCVFHPTKGSWSEAFDCERSRGGSWQIGPGPNSRSIMHTGGEMVYWFACKYGETLHKPDGISPADIEFQLGRGILGRCAEWGR